MEASRDAVAEIIKNATGRDVEIMTTTDYNVAIEALVSGQAQMGYLGAEGYVQANEKNDKFSAPLPQAMQMAHSMKPATTAASA